MILSAQSIRRRSVGLQSMIRPFSERTIHLGLSYGLGPAGYDLRIAETLVLEPGEFRLASTVETLSIPNDIQGELKDKSTWARKGLTVQNTVFDPGFDGYATIEPANHSSSRIEIAAGTAIAQMIFEMLDEPTEAPYSGKYQRQQSGPQPAR